MIVRMIMDWDRYKKGKEYACEDAVGCLLIGTGVADMVTPDAPPKAEPSRQNPKDHPKPKED